MKKALKFRHQAAVIEWLDAHARNQAVEYLETEIPGLHKPEDCKFLALVIREDEKGLTLYNEETGPDCVRGVSFIPRAMIKSVTYVKLVPIPSHTAPAPSSAAPAPSPLPAKTE